MRWTKEHSLLLFVTATFLAVAYAALPPSFPPNLRVELTKQKGDITRVDDVRKAQFSRTFFIDRLEFPEGLTLRHPSYGELGVSSDFFLEISGTMEVKEDGLYEFTFGSDDGFRFIIDGKTVSEFPLARPYASTTETYELKKGVHNILVAYFQGFGPLGLTGTYRKLPNGRSTLIGRSSRDVSFQPQKRLQ